MSKKQAWHPAHLASAKRAAPNLRELGKKIGDEQLRLVVLALLQGDQSQEALPGLDVPPAVDPNGVAIPLVREFMRLEAVLAQLAAALESLPEPVVSWWVGVVNSAITDTAGNSSLDAWHVQREVSRAADQLAQLSRLWNGYDSE